MAKDKRLRQGRWLTPNDFEGVSRKHIRTAVKELAAGGPLAPFRESTDYDVVLKDGKRLPPKAVFGHAARAALAMDVRPGHFRGGAGTPCFREIAKAGFGIEPKSRTVRMPANPADRWAEGHPRRVQHLRYERSRAAVRKKKQMFREANGHLKCEKCGFDPMERYESENAEACIEVHHRIGLGTLGRRRNTRVEDLQCVCANCHRVLHRRMEREQQGDGAKPSSVGGPGSRSGPGAAR